jgi:hypothetical protein
LTKLPQVVRIFDSESPGNFVYLENAFGIEGFTFAGKRLESRETGGKAATR